MNWKEIPLTKKIYLFELDDVLYAKQDYLLQIYYLFAQFVDFSESTDIATDLVKYMREIFLEKGEREVFEHTQASFKFTTNYQENFDRLMVNGQLPLKLLLYTEIKLLFASIIENGGQIAILTKGNPALQLNKLKHIDWQGFDTSIKVYFVDELHFRNLEPFTYIASENNLDTSDLCFIDSKLS